MNKLTKKLSILFASIATAMGVGFVGSAKTAKADSGTATYTVSSKTAVTESGGPTGSSATYTQTYSTASQLTANNSATLTLSGYAGYKITAITLSMKSNTSRGAGSFTATAGSETLASNTNATTFDKWFDNTSYGTSYRDVHVTMTNADYAIATGDTVTLLIKATTNSLYIQSYTIAWESAASSSATLTSINVTSPTKLNDYQEGEVLDVTGFKVEEVYDDGSTIDITSDTSKYTVSPELSTALVAGNNTFTVTYTADTSISVTGGTFTATASARILTSIAVTTLPNKTRYIVGESFDETGLTITATYADGDTVEVSSGFTTSGFDSSAKGTKTITVNYNDVVATFEITVVELTGIIVATMPTKTYYQGDAFSVSDVVVKGVYSDGLEETIDSSKLSADVTTFENIGSQTVVISYEGFTASFTVVVEEKPAIGTATISMADESQITTKGTSTAIWEETPVTFTVNKGSSSTNVGNGSYYSNPALRVYKSQEVIIDAGANVITNVTINLNNTATGLSTNSWTGGTASQTSKVVTITPSNGVTKLSTTVSATTQISSVTVEYRVTKMSVTGVELSDSELVFENRVADAQTLTATVLPTTATNKNVSWSVVGDAVTVSDGVVTPVKAGTATITVTTEDGGFTASCTATVNKDLGVTITPSITDTQLEIGQTVQLNYELTGLDKDTVASPTVVWETVSGNQNVLSVTSAGLVTAMGVGTDSIKVTINGEVSATIEYEVLHSIVEVEKVTISLPEGASKTLKTGQTMQLSAIVTPSDATNTDVTWSTDDAEIVSVDINGLITAGAKSGNATITVTSDADVAIKDTIVITVNNPVEGIVLDNTELALNTNSTAKLVATITPENATNKNITWSSNAENIASVDQEGNITTYSKTGTATITATTEDGAYSASCVVTVTKAPVIAGGVYTGSTAVEGAEKLTVASSYTNTYNSDNWVLTFGGNSKSGGSNNNNSSKCRLTNYYDGTEVTADDYAWALATKSTLSNVSKITFAYDAGSGTTNGKAYLTYSTDGTTYSLVPLTNGTQGMSVATAGTYTFEFNAIQSAYYAVIIKNTASDGNFRFDNLCVMAYNIELDNSETFVNSVNAIGTVSLDSGKAIEDAKTLYSSLTEEEKAMDTVIAAKASLDAKEAEYNALMSDVNAVIEKINSFGEITVDNIRSKISIIDEARAAYDALTSEEQAYVTNYSTLTYYQQVTNLIKDIDAIGTVTIDSEDEINNALAIFSELSQAQADLVVNHVVLDAALDRLNSLKSAKAQADTFIEFMNEYDVDTITYDDKGHIEALSDLYDEQIKNTDAESFITAEDIAKLNALKNKIEKLTSAHDFVAKWSEMRTKGGETGICGYLTDSEDTTLSTLLREFASFDAETQKLIRAETDIVYGETTVTIGETMDYMASVRDWVKNIVNPTSSELNGIVLTTNTESNSLVALFAIVGLVAVSAYYFLEKKKLSK